MTGEPAKRGRVYPMPKAKQASGGGVSHGRRIAALEERMLTVENTVTEVKADTAQILDVLTHGKSLVGFVQKHGGRIVAFGVGAAVAGGWLPEKVGNFVTNFF